LAEDFAFPARGFDREGALGQSCGGCASCLLLGLGFAPLPVTSFGCGIGTSRSAKVSIEMTTPCSSTVILLDTTSSPFHWRVDRYQVLSVQCPACHIMADVKPLSGTPDAEADKV
jgi:hypothetical protein